MLRTLETSVSLVSNSPLATQLAHNCMSLKAQAASIETSTCLITSSPVKNSIMPLMDDRLIEHKEIAMKMLELNEKVIKNEGTW